MTSAHSFESRAAAAAEACVRAETARRIGSAFSSEFAAGRKPVLPGRLTPPRLLLTPEAGPGQRLT